MIWSGWIISYELVVVDTLTPKGPVCSYLVGVMEVVLVLVGHWHYPANH